MKYNIIGSSSSGNAVIIEDFLLLDCGVSYKKIKSYLNKIKIIFISHSHTDHLCKKTIEQINYNYPNMKYIVGSFEVCAKLSMCHVAKKNIYVLSSNKWYDLGALKIKLEKLYHDVSNYGIHFEIDSKKGIYFTDTCRADHIDAKNYDLYLVENNYQQEILEEHIKNCDDRNQINYLYRVMSTHLSKSNCDDFLINNMSKNSEFVYLHKSKYNNTEDGELKLKGDLI